MSNFIWLRVLSISVFLCSSLFSQSDSTWTTKPNFHLAAFADVFYAFDFNKPKTNFRQPFLYNHNRHNEFNLNLGVLSLAVEHTKYRANLGLQAGTYVDDNYANESNSLRNVSEANIGISLSKRNRIWLDVGVLPSHIGFEGAQSSENSTLTRSICAENSPYFQAGAKLTFQPNEKWEIAGLVLNGWQRIQRVPGNSLPSFGSQIQFTTSEKIKLNWSTFIGTIDKDQNRRMRYFSNLYADLKPSKNLHIMVGFDWGMQQLSKNSITYNLWLTPTIIGQYKLSSNWKTSLRVEYFQDNAETIIQVNTVSGFRIFGFSMNFDYSPTPNLLCRIEGRLLSGDRSYFSSPNGLVSQNFIICGSIAFKLKERISLLKNTTDKADSD